jgi:aspartyl aminopeptidase
MKSVFPVLVLILFPAVVLAQLSTRSSWTKINEKNRTEVFKFAEEYKAFMSEAKTDLTFVKEMVALAEKSGFKPLTENASWVSGAKYYDVNRNRTMCLIVVGKKKLKEGVRLIGGHIDSPHLQLKGRPLYQSHDFAMFQTIYHGGIKKYQWVNLPLALIGRIDKTDGTTVWVNVGNRPGEPVFIIPDLAPHVDRPYRDRTARNVIQGEELDPVVGSIAQQGMKVEDQVMKYLENTYKISRADFISAELTLVPALQPADVGFDKGMVAAYGQDDRLCSYVAARASMVVQNPPWTTISFLVNNEESGSNNNTGANSDYLRGLIGRLLHLETAEQASEFHLRQVLQNTQALSADVTTGINPLFPDVQESSNAAKLGYGVVIKLYGRGSSPHSEFTARFRGILEKSGIAYQTHTYKVDVGGGGTIGNFLARENMEVLDCGVPLLSMHSPYSVCSKVDLWWLYRAFQAFYER